VQFTASADLCEKLRRAQDLLRHQIPDGDPAAVFDRALTALLEQLEKRKTGATRRSARRMQTPHPDSELKPASPGTAKSTEITGSPRARSRYIPAEVRRTVWARDGGRCAFTGRDGYRCPERGRLEFHHVEPYARGGPATVENISLRCRAHNGHESDRMFGGGRGPMLVREKALRWGGRIGEKSQDSVQNRVRTISSENFPDGARAQARLVSD
jgi:5-methylcytosine-specific restriction endonuclease McrA